jgi:hypothetical protein
VCTANGSLKGGVSVPGTRGANHITTSPPSEKKGQYIVVGWPSLMLAENGHGQGHVSNQTSVYAAQYPLLYLIRTCYCRFKNSYDSTAYWELVRTREDKQAQTSRRSHDATWAALQEQAQQGWKGRTSTDSDITRNTYSRPFPYEVKYRLTSGFPRLSEHQGALCRASRPCFRALIGPISDTLDPTPAVRRPTLASPASFLLPLYPAAPYPLPDQQHGRGWVPAP